MPELHLPVTPPTYEEAKHCPRCKEEGMLASTTPVTMGRGVGGKVEVFKCMNERCRWFETGWTIQINPDGTIPVHRPGAKQFDTSAGLEVAAQRELDKMAEELRLGESPNIRDL